MKPLRRRVLIAVLLALALLVAFADSGCATRSAASAAPAAPPPPLLLISLDGFRSDYCDLYTAETPHLRQLMREGVHARGLIPVYPSNTFPNHYTIVTGLYPSHHGIINNTFYDPTVGKFFHYNQTASAQDPRWWGGEPVWITAVKEGRTSACAFWPGSEAEIEDRHATWWTPYDYKIPFEQRLDQLATWLTLPPERRPAVTVFYLEETNSVGHAHGPHSPEIAAAVKLLDARVGAILDRLAAIHVAANIVVVSDHGMAPTDRNRIVFVDDYLDLATTQVDFDESVAGLRPLGSATVETMMTALAKIPRDHAIAYRAEDLPPRFHIDADNPRVPPVWIVPAEGWEVMTRQDAAHWNSLGQHGYDPALPSMHGILIARGPSFRRDGSTVPAVENVNVYNLLCAAAGLHAAPNDGDDRLVRSMLRQ
jgi:predicted AlkP superfamily pyrophosphatase or phosphodiesterase